MPCRRMALHHGFFIGQKWECGQSEQPCFYVIDYFPVPERYGPKARRQHNVTLIRLWERGWKTTSLSHCGRPCRFQEICK